MFYFVIFLLLTSFAILEHFNLNKNGRKFLTFIAWLILVLVAGLRFETGGDWDTYTDIFHRIRPLSDVIHGKYGVSGIEFGYILLNSVIKEFGGNIQYVFFIITFTNTTLLVDSLKKYTDRVLLALLIYYGVFYFQLEMIYTRQSLAVILSFFALRYIENRQFWKYLLIIGLAMTFHRMALVMLPFYFLLTRKVSASIWIFLVLTGALLMALNVSWFTFVYLQFSKLLGGEFYSRALFYTSEGQYAVVRGISVGFALNLLLFILFIWKKHEIESQNIGIIFFNLFVYSILLYYYTYEVIEISNRFRYFFFISIIVLFPLVINHLKAFFKLPILLFIVSYSFFFSRSIFLEESIANAYNPYQNYILCQMNYEKGTGQKRLDKAIQEAKSQRKELQKTKK